MNLSNQVVLVTGGSRGLGASIVRAFAKQGAKVVVNYFSSEEKAFKLASEFPELLYPIQADVTDEQQVKDMFRKAEKHFGTPITTIINNALIHFRFDPVARYSPETISWQNYLQQLEGSVKASLHTLQAGLESMKQANFGRIITIGTNLVDYPVVPYHDYTTGKAALLGFTRNMAAELGQYGITVNMISAGLLRETDASSATSAEVFGIIESSTPRRKVTTPEDVADTVLFFASDWSRAVTGQTLTVDGGFVMR